MDGGHCDLGGGAGCEPGRCAPAARAARGAARMQATRFAPPRSVAQALPPSPLQAVQEASACGADDVAVIAEAKPLLARRARGRTREALPAAPLPCRRAPSAHRHPPCSQAPARARAASGNDWQKDRQFHALNAEAGVVEVKAVRGGHECLVVNEDVVVGDVLLLDTGDRVAADGLAFEAHGLTIDEARPGP